MRTFAKLLLTGAVALGSLTATAVRAEDKLLNVSYDPTRELYEEINAQFAEHYKSKTGKSVAVTQSHGGSGKQARAVIDGLKADVVTLALGADVTPIEKSGLIQPGWESELPYNSAPYTSTIVFVVRKGNPKGVKDWNDLVKPGIAVITPNPKTSGGARWNFLAAWAYAAGAKGHDLSTEAGLKAATDAAKNAKSFPVIDDARGRDFVAALYRNVPVLDTGARGSSVTFAQKNIGDVLIAWENEAWLVKQEFGAEQYDLVYPSLSILAEPQVTIVDKVVDDRGTRALAQAYLEFLYTPEAQDTIGALHYRPRSIEALARYKAELPPLPLVTIDETFGGWAKAQAHYFGDGGVFDQLYKATSAAAK
jgi:sulfate transport system substrate-binding protein